MQILTGNIERSLSEKDVNFTCFVKKLPVFNESVTEESPPGPGLRPWIAIKIWLNFVPKCSISNDQIMVQIMAWCRSATSHYVIEWWLSSLTHTSVAGNIRIVIYGECCYAIQIYIECFRNTIHICASISQECGTPVISGFPPKGGINAENVSMLCGWKCLKSGTHIKYHV